MAEMARMSTQKARGKEEFTANRRRMPVEADPAAMVAQVPAAAWFWPVKTTRECF